VAVTITAVNDPPSFFAGANQTAVKGSGFHSVAGWATAMSAGPIDERTQTLTFTATPNNSTLFASQPFISPTGTLSYAPSATVVGVATVTVRLRDNAGTANGGRDTSDPQVFTITVINNRAPVAVMDSFEVIKNTTLSVPAPGVLANDSDPDGDQLTATILVWPTHASQLSWNGNGSFSYTPQSDWVGSDVIVYRVSDPYGWTASASATIDVIAPLEIPTSTLGDGILFQSISSWVYASGGYGSRTYSITSGRLPLGLSLNPTTGIITGSPAEAGTFPFTVRVADCASGCQASTPRQTTSAGLTLRVLTLDQALYSGAPGAVVSFGGTGGAVVAQVFTVGATGSLAAVRLNGSSGLTCTGGTAMSAEIQGVTPATGRPDGHRVAAGIAAVSPGSLIVLADPFPVTPGLRYALVMSATGPCSLAMPPSSDSYAAGSAFSDTGSGWQPLLGSDSLRKDLSIETLIVPASGYLVTKESSDEGDKAVALADGRILLVDTSGQAKIYSAGDNSLTSKGTMLTRRVSDYTLTLLASGRVLIVGGHDWNTGTLLVTTNEVFDPATGDFTAAGTLTYPRASHTTTRLADGTILIAGGGSAYVERCDVDGLNCAQAGTMAFDRSAHTATLLADSTVLLAGGANGRTPSAEVYNPATGLSVATATPMNASRRQHTATLLGDGRVLLAGGVGPTNDPLATTELYRAGAGFVSAGTMSSPRSDHAATLLSDGSVLLSGGQSVATQWPQPPPLSTAERFVPDPDGAFVAAPSLLTTRTRLSALLLPNGRILISGGLSSSRFGAHSAELYDWTGLMPLPGARPIAVPIALLPDAPKGWRPEF